MIKCKGFIGKVTECVKSDVAYIGIDTQINSFLENNNIEIISIDKTINNNGRLVFVCWSFGWIFYRNT